jgi:hypothetical protein
MKSFFWVLLALFFLVPAAEARILITFEQNLTWITRYSRVLEDGKPIELKDLRGPFFSGFFGYDEHWNLGTMTHGEERCEMRIPYSWINGKAIPFDSKTILFSSGSIIEWVKDLVLDSSESDFDKKALFIASGFEVTPYFETSPTRLLVPIRCKGDEDLAKLIKKHFKGLAAVAD